MHITTKQMMKKLTQKCIEETTEPVWLCVSVSCALIATCTVCVTVNKTDKLVSSEQKQEKTVASSADIISGRPCYHWNSPSKSAKHGKYRH